MSEAVKRKLQIVGVSSDGEVEKYCLEHNRPCLLYTSDAADERSSEDLGGRRIIKKKNSTYIRQTLIHEWIVQTHINQYELKITLEKVQKTKV